MYVVRPSSRLVSTTSVHLDMLDSPAVRGLSAYRNTAPPGPGVRPHDTTTDRLVAAATYDQSQDVAESRTSSQRTTPSRDRVTSLLWRHHRTRTRLPACPTQCQRSDLDPGMQRYELASLQPSLRATDRVVGLKQRNHFSPPRTHLPAKSW